MSCLKLKFLKKYQNGASLIEVLLVVIMLGFIVVLLANIPNAIGLIQKSKYLELAREIASKQIEDKRQVEYSNLVNDTSGINDSRMSLIPQASGTVVIEDCNSQICTNSENIKQVTVTISWTEKQKPQQVVLSTFIGEGGLNQ